MRAGLFPACFHFVDFGCVRFFGAGSTPGSRARLRNATIATPGKVPHAWKQWHGKVARHKPHTHGAHIGDKSCAAGDKQWHGKMVRHAGESPARMAHLADKRPLTMRRAQICARSPFLGRLQGLSASPVFSVSSPSSAGLRFHNLWLWEGFVANST